MQKLNGFIKVHRKLVQWGWYQDYVVKDLFLHLLLTASFRESQWMGRTIQRGQVVTSYANLAADLGFSVKQIRTALNKLKSTGEVASESTNRYTIITVVNWEKYQVFEYDEADDAAGTGADKGQAEGRQGADKGQHLKNVKNNKECKERKEESSVGQLSSFGEPLPPGMTMAEFEERYKEMTK